MSSTSGNKIPYPIPGPAENIFSHMPSNATSTYDAATAVGAFTQATSKKIDIRPFTQGAWQLMLEAEGFKPFGRKKMRHSVQSFKRLAMSEGRRRADRLVLRVMALESVGKDAQALLGDITGTVESTFHSEVFRSLRNQIEIGTVLILQNVSALILFDRAGSLQARCENLRIHLSIQLCNIERAFRSSPGAVHRESVPDSLTGWMKQLKDAYASDDVPLQRRNRRSLLQREFLNHYSVHEKQIFGEPKDSWKKIMRRSISGCSRDCDSRITKSRLSNRKLRKAPIPRKKSEKHVYSNGNNCKPRKMRLDLNLARKSGVRADMKCTGEVHELLKNLTLKKTATAHGKEKRRSITLASETSFKVEEQVSTERPMRNSAVNEMVRLLLRGLNASDFPDL